MTNFDCVVKQVPVLSPNPVKPGVDPDPERGVCVCGKGVCARVCGTGGGG